MVCKQKGEEHKVSSVLVLCKKFQINLSQFLHHLHSNKSVHCGLQASIRKLKSGHIKLLVLSADLKPRYVANQIIVQALANNADIRILCVPNMATFTQNLLNFPCYALVVGHEHWLEMSDLNAWTANIIDENFPIPQLIKEHYAKQQDTHLSSPMQVDKEFQKGKQKEKAGSKSFGSDVNLKHLHLTRDNCGDNQRAFVPNNAINLKPIALEIESLNKIKSDFISFETYSNSNDEPSTSFDFKSAHGFGKQPKNKGKRPLAMYRELTIHKIQNNPNKVKKIKDKKNKKKNLLK